MRELPLPLYIGETRRRSDASDGDLMGEKRDAAFVSCLSVIQEKYSKLLRLLINHFVSLHHFFLHEGKQTFR